MSISRRSLFRDVVVAGAGVVALGTRSDIWASPQAIAAAIPPAEKPVDPADPWSAVPGILARIVPPQFPNRDFVITNFGARTGRDSSAAIAKAIDRCVRSGGGRVVVPKGEFLTGAIRLQSNVNLHLQPGAVLKFSRDPNDYPVVYTRWEGVELMNYSPLIYAFECQNVAVTGEGTLDGQADEEHWWPWKGVTSGKRKDPTTDGVKIPAPQVQDNKQLLKQGADGVPVEQRVYGPGHYLRPTFVEPYRCKNVLIEGVTLINAPFWVLHPTLCTNVTVRNVKTHSLGPNNDGCDPECCRDVLIEDCVFDAGDDCIALKSGRNADGRRVNAPVENVVIRRCQMKAGHGGITVGSEMSGGARNVFAEQCRLDSPDLERGLRLKTNSARGGFIENVFVRDIEIGNVQLAPMEIDLLYAGETGSFTPAVRNVWVDRMKSARSKYGLYIRGLEEAPVRGVVVRNSAFRGVAAGHVIEGTLDLTLGGVTMESSRKERP